MNGIELTVFPHGDLDHPIGVVHRHWGATYLEELNRDGGGSFLIDPADPLLVDEPDLLGYTNWVRVRVNGDVRGWWEIAKKRVVQAGEGDAAAEMIEVSGPGLLAQTAHAIVYPHGGVSKYAGETRTFNFAGPNGSLWMDPSDWTDAVSLGAANSNVWVGHGWSPVYPEEWPVTAWWVWDRPATLPYPPLGRAYFRREFTSTGTRKVRVFVSVADTAVVLLDGQPLLSVAEFGANRRTYSKDIELLAGSHILAVKAEHRYSGPAGVVVAMVEVGDDPSPGGSQSYSNADRIVWTGDGGWKVAAYPSPAPGWSPGLVLKTLTDEAVARGADIGPLTYGFTGTHDSNAEEWPEALDWSWNVGTPLREVVSEIVETVADVWVDPDWVLHMAPVRGTNRSAQVGDQQPVVFRRLSNVLGASTEAQAELVNTLLTKTTDGWVEQSDPGGSVAKYGRRESFLSVVSASEDGRAPAMIREVFSRYARPRTAPTIEITEVEDHVPWVDFGVGDWVLAPSDDDPQVLTERRVMSIAVTEDEETGRAVYSVEIDTIQEAEDERRSRWIAAVAKGSLNGGVAGSSGGSSPAYTSGFGASGVTPPGESTTPPVQSSGDKRYPKTPTGLTLSTSAYADTSGRPRGQVNASWDPVTTATDGSAFPVGRYDVAVRVNELGSQWSIVRWTTHPTVSVVLNDLDPGSQWVVRVRAVGEFNNRAGEWSTEESVTVTDDTTPPPIPSAPVLSSRLGTIRVEWDGLDEDGNAMPSDFARVDVAMGETATPTAVIDQMAGRTGVVITGVPVGQTRHFRFKAWDRSGNESDWSAVNQIVVTGIDAPDIEAGAVRANHIEVGSIQSEHLGFGVRSTNLIDNPGFEETGEEHPTSGDHFTVPGWVLETGTSSTTRVRLDGEGSNRAARGRGLLFLYNDTEVYNGARAITAERIPVVAGREYAVSCKAWSHYGDGSLIRIGVYWFGEGGTPLGSVSAANQQLQSGITAFQDVQGVIIAPEGAVEARLDVQHRGTTGYVGNTGMRVDDVAMVPLGSGAVEITRAGIRMWDAEGQESINLSSVGAASNFATFGSGLATISDEGAVAGEVVSANQALFYQGEELQEVLARFPRGVQARGRIQGSDLPDSMSGTDIGLFSLSFEAEAGRLYEVSMSPMLISVTDLVSPGSIGLRIRYTVGSSTPTISNGSVLNYNYELASENGFHTIQLPPSLLTANGQVNLLFILYRSSGTMSAGVYDSQWITAAVKDVGPAIPDVAVVTTAGGTAEPPTPPVKRYVKTYTRSWDGSYLNGSYTSWSAGNCYQGYYSSGTPSRSMIGFPSMTSDLSGATVEKIEVYLYFAHWYYNAGGTASIWMHGATSRPSTFSSIGSGPVVTSSWGKGQGKWVTLPSSLYAGFKSGAYRGIALRAPGDSTNRTYYGYATGAQTKIRVTYVK